ncbi:MAG TPA: hypothetical protein PKE64_22575 [Anaerolineae bacterium]|nr:hypothetical protein [Anaerolineae bacterium]HMR66805.1 hypothetical protein [Anaerolineae bacterium]
MEEETTGQSKLFVILAVALIGLLVLGLVGIGGVFVIRQNMREQQLAAQRAVPTVVINLPQPTAALAPVGPTPTSTRALPTATPTAVTAPGSDGEQASISQADSSLKADDEATTQKPDTAQEANQSSANGIKLPLPNNKPGDSAKPGTAPAATPGEVPNTGLEAVDAVLMALAFIAVFAVARRMRLASSR